jgi:hypothetical protein
MNQDEGLGMVATTTEAEANALRGTTKPKGQKRLTDMRFLCLMRIAEPERYARVTQHCGPDQSWPDISKLKSVKPWAFGFLVALALGLLTNRAFQGTS